MHSCRRILERPEKRPNGSFARYGFLRSCALMVRQAKRFMKRTSTQLSGTGKSLRFLCLRPSCTSSSGLNGPRAHMGFAM